jgi:murein L,D-transpeptidase YcbB/YkuD
MAPPTFRKLANDFAQGATPASQRIRWHLGPAAGPDLVERKMEEALGGAGVAATLSSLLPTHPQYAALKAALASTPAEDRARRAVLATNLDRWRWMPRAMGSHYLLVNVPGFELRQVEAGQVIATHRVIVGKPRTPTPQFAATVSGVILNPEWVIPASIQAEGIGRQVATNPSAARARGYVKTPTGITQLPGPNNALGQMKLRMPNPYTIYVHDTPAKALFARSVRAYSHGCIRTQNPFDLAERLLQGGTWDRARIDAAVAEGRTTIDIDVPRPIPIYVLYFTAWASDGGEVRIFDDIYGRDAPVKAALGWGEAKSAALASREAWESSCSQG